MTVQMVDGLPLFAVDAARETWRCVSSCISILSQMRFSADMELYSSGECEQVQSHQAYQYYLAPLYPFTHNTIAITWRESKMKHDPTLERIWETRRQIAKRFDYDPKKLGEYYMELQKRHQDRLVESPKNEENKIEIVND